ncbi:hypothetical protein EN780_03130 [Mesorhizobium sp. M4B.F.Ca.ET.089.01.1.1]|uniref:hypothetical protein n=1 Tax=Mesorhizobium sp. M4B.F.Ca.ET.089.01.1.1 TaxID=2496662 RepID=UPI000FE3CED6|nr:hypothetical protein [Mesorhizobium sp. M4B.F.Ca.ET.089.01.1.1]RWX70526.1 hypothetical protein EN780_03130 [Mesorhizobium sp. M4B.F.Ca.ET.089.01.1.1]
MSAKTKPCPFDDRPAPAEWAEMRGGPQNFHLPLGGMPVTSKCSFYISGAEFFRLYDAVQYANSCGRLMNAELTISFDGSDARSQDFFRSFLARYRAWCEYRQIPCVYIYVWERPPNTRLHAHLQLHIPDNTQGKAVAWVRRTLDCIDPTSGDRLVADKKLAVRKAIDVVSQWAWFRYIVKGINPRLGNESVADTEIYRFARHFGIKGVAQGIIPFKRTGRSLQISDRAQRLAMKRGEFHRVGIFDWDSTFEEAWSDFWYRQFLARKERAAPSAISSLF